MMSHWRVESGEQYSISGAKNSISGEQRAIALWAHVSPNRDTKWRAVPAIYKNIGGLSSKPITAISAPVNDAK